MTNKINIGCMVEVSDRELIKQVADMQRRSMASFLVESAIIRARKIMDQNKLGETNATANTTA